MADSGAAGQQLRHKLNQKSESAVKEYITSSKKTQSTNAAFLACFEEDEPETKKAKVEEDNPETKKAKVENPKEKQPEKMNFANELPSFNFMSGTVKIQSCTINLYTSKEEK